MNRERVIRLLGGDWGITEDFFRKSLGTDVELLANVNDGILANGGKMLRPILSLCMAHACGSSDVTERCRLAACVELLHNATLLHDDVADNSMVRRGQPTVNSLYGPVPAVLVGDFWLASAIGLIAESEHYRELSKAFAKTIRDLVEGEMLQQQKAFSSDTTEEDSLRIIYCKTGSLFDLACTQAVTASGCNPGYAAAASAYGTAIGYAFQIKDDILDYIGEDIGKPVGADLQEKKITLPLLGAIRSSGREEEIRRMVSEMDKNPCNCEQIRDFVIASGGIGYAEDKLREYISRACDAVSVLPDSEYKEVLLALAKYNALRKK